MVYPVLLEKAKFLHKKSFFLEETHSDFGFSCEIVRKRKLFLGADILLYVSLLIVLWLFEIDDSGVNKGVSFEFSVLDIRIVNWLLSWIIEFERNNSLFVDYQNKI